MYRSLTLRSGLLSAVAALALTFAPRAGAQDCAAHAGTMSTDSGPVCLQNGEATLVGIPSGTAVVPPGYVQTYVLTRTNALIIAQVSATAHFTVNSVDIWRIHSLVYNPTTLDLGAWETGTYLYDLQAQLVQGGGAVCASLDISGAPVKTGECQQPCTAKASSMGTDMGPVCLVNGEATLTATPTGTPLVPPGYEVTYILTRTNGLIIEQVSTTPEFTVNSVDIWRIHQLVYDPTTLDLSAWTAGTYLYDLQALLPQGGGSICASLDISGAPVKTGICEQVCTADAGTISAEQADLCLENGAATLSAMADGNAVVPAGYTTRYILTTGADLIMQSMNTQPEFIVNAPGLYTIHTLVYDPNTLDLSTVVPGQTMAADIVALLQQGGGLICASLDVDGAEFQVTQCAQPCTAYAGTLTAEDTLVCLTDGHGLLAASPNGDAVVPDGYVVAYVLAEGGVIRNVEPTPFFDWPLTGLFTMHAFVYDPNTFDLAANIQLDMTTLDDVFALLVPGGGVICADLDMLGASFHIIHCAPPCTAGENVTITVCYTDPPVNLFDSIPGNPCPGGTWASAGAAFSGVFDPTVDAAGVYVYSVMGLDGMATTALVTVNVVECGGNPPCDAGISTDVVVCFTDPFFLLYAALDGTPCPNGSWTAPDGSPSNGFFNPETGVAGIYTYTVAGGPGQPDQTSTVTVTIVECPQEFTGHPHKEPAVSVATGVDGPVMANALTVWPNPATDQLRVRLPFAATTSTRVDLIDATGRTVSTSLRLLADGFTIDVADLAPGAWMLRVADATHVATARFIRAVR